MSTMKISKRLLFLLVVALFCSGCNKQDDLLIRTIVMGGGLFSNPTPRYNLYTYIIFSHDGTMIVSGHGPWSSIDEVMKVWRVSDGSLQYTIGLTTEGGYTPAVTAISFDPSVRLMATGASDANIRIWRISDGTLLKSFKSPYGVITDLSYSPDGKILVGCHSVGVLVFWNTENDSVIRTQWPSKVEGSFIRAKFNSIGAELITGTLHGEIRILRVKDGALLRRFGAIGSGMISLGVARSENVLATTHADGSIKIWRVSDGSLVNTIETDSSIECRVALNSQGSLLAVGYYYNEFREPRDFLSLRQEKRDYDVKLYRTSDRTLLHSFKGHRWDVTSVKFSPDDTLLASCGMDGSIKIWDIKSFKGEGF